MVNQKYIDQCRMERAALVELSDRLYEIMKDGSIPWNAYTELERAHDRLRVAGMRLDRAVQAFFAEQE